MGMPGIDAQGNSGDIDSPDCGWGLGVLDGEPPLKPTYGSTKNAMVAAFVGAPATANRQISQEQNEHKAEIQVPG